MAHFEPECSTKKCNNLPATHLFVELTSLEELSFPTSSSTRIKYTCLDASAHYLAVGSTSGTVYLFSRFASKYRNRISSVPIQVISIKDGPVIKLSISPDEKYLATASRRGSLTVTALVGIGQNPITLFSTDSHVGTGENNQPIHITELCWASDSSKIFAGDTKGRISRTRIRNRNFFRSPTDIIFETDSEIVQFDLRDDSLLVSTLTRCCVCDLKTRSCVQVGKRLRKGRFGAAFYSDQRKRKLLNGEKDKDQSIPADGNGSSELTVIFASRPNGRLWEANGRGVVYSTHQYRNMRSVCQFPVITFKEDDLLNSLPNGDEMLSINFGLLKLVKCQDCLFLMTKTDTTFCLIDPTDSHMVLVSTVDCIGSVNEYAVSDADVFLLSSRTGSLRKLTLFTLEKAVEKLHWRQCYSQAAQLIYANYILNKNHSSSSVWKYEQLEDILNKFTISLCKSQIPQKVLDTLRELLNEMKRSGDIKEKSKTAIYRLNSGIHRVVQIMENSGYEDDFTFRAPSPLRIRSKSTPNSEIGNGWKRRSLPLNHGITAETNGDELGFDGSEERRKKLINEARMLLIDAEKMQVNHLLRNGSVESLRTLLDCSNTSIMFDQQITIDDAIKDLEAAKKFLRLIGSHKNNEQEKMQRPEGVDFKSLFGRRDPLEMLEKCVESIPLSINVNVARLRTVRRTRRGARIVKGIKPCGKRNVKPEMECKESEQTSDHSMKRDLTSSESLNLNCNGTEKGDEDAEQNSNEQSTKDEIGLLCKSYVVEKNFVAVRPIEITWTMNGGDEDNDLVSMKSSEATIPLNVGGDERLMQSSEMTVAPTTLTSFEAKKLDEDNSAHCLHCGLHRLWCYVMVIGPKVSQLRVTVDQFTDGGVPTTLEDWKKLFEYRAAAVEDGENPIAQLCDDCGEFFEFDEHLKQEASLMRETVERIAKRNAKKKFGEHVVRMVAKKWDDDLVYRIFFKDILISTKTLSTIRKKIGANPDSEVSKKELSLGRCPDKFFWLRAVTISQLLLCMRYCEGFGVVVEFLKNNETLKSDLTVEDWQWLVVMKEYECTRSSNLMPKEVVVDLLKELKISSIESIDGTSSVPVTDNNGSASKSLSGSLTLSVDGNCPCCTLPLKMRVTHGDGYITVFRCGHLYHQVCLREAYLSCCLRCEVERRRCRHKQHNHQHHVASSSSAQRSLAARNPQHIPIKSIRTNVTSTMSLKIPRRT